MLDVNHTLTSVQLPKMVQKIVAVLLQFIHLYQARFKLCHEIDSRSIVYVINFRNVLEVYRSYCSAEYGVHICILYYIDYFTDNLKAPSPITFLKAVGFQCHYRLS